MCRQPNQIRFEIPSWVGEAALAYRLAPAICDRMDFVLKAAEENIIRKTGGPFAAAIFEIETGRLVALGVNLAETQGLSVLHAEIVAISLAQNALGAFNLGGEGLARHELVTSCEPCAMCFGAISSSGVRRIVSGATSSDAETIGLDQGDKPKTWREDLHRRGIETVACVERGAAVEVFKLYARSIRDASAP